MYFLHIIFLLAFCFYQPTFAEKNIFHPSQHPHKIIPWKTPFKKLSPPPPLMGKQMGVVDTLRVTPLGYELDGNVKVFKLILQPIEKIITDTNQKASWYHLIPEKNRTDKLLHNRHIIQKLKCWGINGSMPGPTIEATEGDKIRILVTNELPEPTSIHWHGLEVPNDQDGAAGQTQPPIMPGKTYTYEFTLYQSGTLMYHSGFSPMKQDPFGIIGFFIIHPKTPEHHIDKDVAIMLQEWSILPGNEAPNLVTMSFNWATFNGLAAPLIPHIEVQQGQRVRIRFGNISMNSHPIHIHGYRWEEVGTEGGPIPQTARRKGATINVPPGTTRDVEFVAWNPGLWRLHCHKLHHIMNANADVPMGLMPNGSMFTLVYVKPTDPDAPWQHPSQAALTPMLPETNNTEGVSDDVK